ncbi:MAG: GWxTD domain-containing protein [Bryobacteraceae bacterium]
MITPEERAAFQNLETNEEHEEFIKQFWLRRDPTPGTPENEFKEEHYRRIAQANLRFPTATGTAGWKTDRGRIYIVFGPPDEIDDHSSPGAYNRPEDRDPPNGPHTLPYVDWTYRFIEGVGNNVLMEFVDKTGTHDFRMTLDPNPSRPSQRFVKPIK